jgi:hypothetical protein
MVAFEQHVFCKNFFVQGNAEDIDNFGNSPLGGWRPCHAATRPAYRISKVTVERW